MWSSKRNAVVDPPRMLTRLVASAENPLVEVVVVNDRFEREASGFGRVDVKVPAGVYRVDFRSGAELQERWVVIERENAERTVSVSAAPFASSSAAPLAVGADVREARAARLARDWSLAPRVVHGRGSQLFAFVDMAGVSGDLAGFAGAALLDAMGEPVLALGDAAQYDKTIGAAGACIELAPGTYRLRVPAGNGAALEQTVHLAAGWATQLFVRALDDTSSGPAGSGSSVSVPRPWRAPALDLARAAITMTPVGTAFDPASRETLLVEAARVALAAGQRGVMPRSVAGELRRYGTNPMLGLLACHVLTLAWDPDVALIAAVVEEVEARAPDHPDALALRLWLADRGHRTSAVRIRGREAAYPPMLRHSWRLLTHASVERPELVSPSSVVASVADRIVGGGAWLMWEALDQTQARELPVQSLGTLDEGDVEREWPRTVPLGEMFTSLRPATFLPLVHFVRKHKLNLQGARAVAMNHGLSPLESAVLLYVTRCAGWTQATDGESLFSPSVPNGAVSLPRGRPPRPPLGAVLAPRAAVQALGVPAGAIVRAATGACSRLSIAVDDVPPAHELSERAFFTGDTQKLRFGGQPQRGYLRLEAAVREVPGQPDWFRVRAAVRSMYPRRRALTGEVRFHVHESFGETVYVRPVVRGQAVWEGYAWGAFTIGAVVREGASEVQLELDLATLPTAPELFRAR